MTINTLQNAVWVHSKKKRVLHYTHRASYWGVVIHPSAPKHPLGVNGCLYTPTGVHKHHTGCKLQLVDTILILKMRSKIK